MKQKVKWLLLIGLLSMSFTMLVKSFITIPDSIDGFLKGFGASLSVGALIVAGKAKMKKSD